MVGDVSSVKIGSALPRILDRRYALVKPDYPLQIVLYLLRMKEVDAVPITYPRDSKRRAVFGFSSLPRFMAAGPERFARMLKEPCENVSEDLPSLGADDGVDSLLDAFGSRKLGFALVHGVGGDEHKSSLASLTDVMGLYLTKTIRSDLDVSEVSTPIFSVPETTSVRSALQAMFKRRYRRVFVSEREYVSDRSVMRYAFSPVTLDRVADEGEGDLLGVPISRLERTTAIMVSPQTSLATAALKLRVDRGQCLFLSGGKVATPWDIVMKPWLSGKLRIM